VAHHHRQVLRGGLASGMQGVPEQTATRDAVEHLGGRGLHPGAFAGSQHDHGGGEVWRHGPDSTWHDEGVTASPTKTPSRNRMTGPQRRQQLVSVGRSLFAEKGFEGTSVEEIAAKAGVSKPVIYEHFGGKEGLYAVVVDREIQALLDQITTALTEHTGNARALLEAAALALLDYIENSTDGFRILVRDSPPGQATGSFASLISDIASQVEHILAAEFKRRRLDPKTAPLYAQMLVGMVAIPGGWWLDSRRMKKEDVAAHLVNLAWNGLSGMEARPTLRAIRR
jgi:AcrR family transcriptional regulator